MFWPVSKSSICKVLSMKYNWGSFMRNSVFSTLYWIANSELFVLFKKFSVADEDRRNATAMYNPFTLNELVQKWPVSTHWVVTCDTLEPRGSSIIEVLYPLFWTASLLLSPWLSYLTLCHTLTTLFFPYILLSLVSVLFIFHLQT